MQGFTGVILAGGASRRMGQDKAFLQYDGRSFLNRMRQLLKSVGADRIVVLGRTDVPGGVEDKHPLSGPVTALTDYLATKPFGSRHLVVPVDMPGLNSICLQHLSRETSWAFFEDYMLPLLAIADGEYCTPDRIRDLLALKMAKPLPVTTGMQPSLVNLNTPAELVRWHKNGHDEGAQHHV